MSQPLTFLTARPMFEFLLGLHGHEAPQVTPDQALPVFLELLTLRQAPIFPSVGIRWDVAVTEPAQLVGEPLWAADFPDLGQFAAAGRVTPQ